MKQYADLLERIVATGVQAAAGSVAADQLFDMGVDSVETGRRGRL